jgi:membrane protein implicated in regulation of membrane protease activity
LGNPLKSEGAAFRWLVAFIAGAVLVILVAVLMSSVAAALLGFILLAMVSVFIVRGMAHMLGSPDEDEAPAGASSSRPGEQSDGAETTSESPEQSLGDDKD